MQECDPAILTSWYFWVIFWKQNLNYVVKIMPYPLKKIPEHFYCWNKWDRSGQDIKKKTESSLLGDKKKV